MKKNWSPMTYACIESNNHYIWQNITTFKECQLKCESTAGCKSVDYVKQEPFYCMGSNYNSRTLPSSFHKPCYSGENVSLYAEIVDGGKKPCIISDFLDYPPPLFRA